MERILDWQRGPYLIRTGLELVDMDVVHGFLSCDAYWSKNIPREVVQRGLENCLAFGMYDTGRLRPDGRPAQIGLARVITDRATFAYVSDVFVLTAYRGQGLSKWLMEVVMAHPDLQGLRRWMLLTADAHGLYQRFGFAAPAQPERILERVTPNVYRCD